MDDRKNSLKVQSPAEKRARKNSRKKLIAVKTSSEIFMLSIPHLPPNNGLFLYLADQHERDEQAVNGQCLDQAQSQDH